MHIKLYENLMISIDLCIKTLRIQYKRVLYSKLLVRLLPALIGAAAPGPAAAQQARLGNNEITSKTSKNKKPDMI